MHSHTCYTLTQACLSTCKTVYTHTHTHTCDTLPQRHSYVRTHTLIIRLLRRVCPGGLFMAYPFPPHVCVCVCVRVCVCACVCKPFHTSIPNIPVRAPHRWRLGRFGEGSAGALPCSGCCCPTLRAGTNKSADIDRCVDQMWVWWGVYWRRPCSGCCCPKLRAGTKKACICACACLALEHGREIQELLQLLPLGLLSLLW
jgi:hypothetical protein